MPDFTWGEVEWGSFLWGGYAAPEAGEQGYAPHAKPDTVFLSQAPTGAVADLCVDLGQQGTDLANQTTYADETPSSRAALTYPRCLEVQVVMDTTGAPDGGVLIDHSGDDPGEQTYCLVVANVGAPTVICYQDDGSLGTLAVPTHGTADTVSILWATEVNKLATGAGDACRSEVWVYNHHGIEYAHTSFTHAAPTTDGGWDLTVGDYAGGGDAFSGTIRMVRISEAFHNSVEWYHDWIGTTIAPTLTGATRCETLVPTKASGFADDGQFMHQHSVCAAAVRQMDLRTASPLVNECYFDPDEWVQDFVPAEWAKYPPGVTTAERGEQPFRLMLPYLRYCPVPDSHNRIYVRVQVQNYTNGGTIRELDVRCYSMSRRPIIGGLLAPNIPPPPPLEYYWVDAQTTTDHTSTGTGEWLDLGISKIARDSDGSTWLCLAAEIHDGTADTDARFRIKAWTVDALRLDGVTGPPDGLTLGAP
jgi:hypothetical protein